MASVLSESDQIAAERFVARDHLVLSLARKLLAPDIIDKNDEFLSELDTLIFDISQTHTIVETARRERATYAAKQDKYTSLIESEAQEIQLLREELRQAYDTKGRYDQYRLLAQTYSQLPSREESARNIAEVEAEIDALNQQHDVLQRRMDLSKKDMALLFNALTCLMNRKDDDLSVHTPTKSDDKMDVA